MTLMEEEMLVGDVISQIAYDPGFDGMGCRTPFVGGGGKNVEAARMRKAEFLFLDFLIVLSVVGATLCRARGGGRELEVQLLEEEERQGRFCWSWCGVLMCIFLKMFC